jgi:hypothetical protein
MSHSNHLRPAIQVTDPILRLLGELRACAAREHDRDRSAQLLLGVNDLLDTIAMQVAELEAQGENLSN